MMRRHNDSEQTLEDSVGEESNTLERSTTTTQLFYSALGMYPICVLASTISLGAAVEGGCKGYQS